MERKIRQKTFMGGGSTPSRNSGFAAAQTVGRMRFPGCPGPAFLPPAIPYNCEYPLRNFNSNLQEKKIRSKLWLPRKSIFTFFHAYKLTVVEFSSRKKFPVDSGSCNCMLLNTLLFYLILRYIP